MKKKHYVTLILVAVVTASCTFAVYTQKNCSNSTQKVENPTSASADSASITIQSPLR
jgi:beta-lactam-binding protein with PASTA domain